MPDRTFLSWPFFDESHRRLGAELDAWMPGEIAPLADAHGDVDATCRELVRRLAAGGWLRYAIPAAQGGVHERLDAGPISLFGSEGQRARWLPAVAAGEAIMAFALSEPDAGSDVTAMTTTARAIDGGYVIDGRKTWISNAGIADRYTVFARFPEAGERGFAAFVVDADNPGLRVSERIDVTAPHPLGTIDFEGCRVGADALLGEAGGGMKVALGTLDIFRSTVGAAALGFARRALDEAVSFTTQRRAFGSALSEHQLTRAALAEMAVAVDASALLVYRAAWTRDGGAPRVTREAAMAKLYSTEAAQQVIDRAVQLLGARGVVAGSTVESLYREVRALRIYEGTSEIQKLVIAAQLLAG
jgi:alkylation response protein AidB-like acyl-CoA dehydrogenase